MDEEAKKDFKVVFSKDKGVDVSDGYHTFSELYEHRITLFIALCRLLKRQQDAIGLDTQPEDSFVWRSKLHDDGTMFDGWFIMGIGAFDGQFITYHLPIEKWEETNFATTLEKAHKWDGHTPNDVLTRLGAL